MAGDTATASPAEDDPIVTPLPPIRVQFPRMLGPTPMRPTLEPDAARDMTPAEQLQYATEEYPRLLKAWEDAGKPKGEKPPSPATDTWGASGCQPTSVAMQVLWMLSHPTVARGLVVPNRGDDAPAIDASTPPWVVKWLFDPSGNPSITKYSSQGANEHPPWVPRFVSGKSWHVDNAALWNGPTRITRNGRALTLQKLDMKAIGQGVKDDQERWRLKRTALKSALMKCGPLAINLLHPGHFVLLYGYRGRHMYILDPGMVLFGSWALGQKRVAASKTSVDHFFAVLAPTAGDLNASNVVLDAEHVFSVSAEGAYKGTFLDVLVNAEGYAFPDIEEFNEFRSAAAPDGRLPGGTLPAPYTPGQAPPSAPSAPPGTPTPPAVDPPPPPKPAPATGPDSGWLGWAEDLFDKLLGRENKAAARTTVTVTEQRTGRPVVGAQVEITGIQMGDTEADGVWRSADFLPGTYDLKVRKAAFGPPAEGGAAATEGQVWKPGVVFASGDGQIAVQMVDLTMARAVITVREYPSRKLLGDVDVEIWSIVRGSTSSRGIYLSPSFKAGRSYDVKVRKSGYGPAPSGDAPVKAGEVCEPRVPFARGEQALTLFMAEERPFVVPPPADKKRDRAELRIESSTNEVDYASFVAADGTLTFPFFSDTWNLTASWLVYGPKGEEVTHQTDLGGGWRFKLDASTLKQHVDELDNDAFGTWTVRFVKDDYYDDHTFVLMAPMPPPPPPPSKPGPSPHPSPAPLPPPVTPGGGAVVLPGAATHLGDAITVGAWENYVGDTVPPEIIAQIQGVRSLIPHDKNLKQVAPYNTKRPKEHCWRLGDMGQKGYVESLRATYLAPADQAMRDALAKYTADPTPANQQDYYKAKVDRMLTGACIALIPREGSPASINTYDSAILTWGIGFAWRPGVVGLITASTKKNEKIRNYFYNCGFRCTGNGFQVVDVVNGKVLVDDEAAEHFTDPLQSDDTGRNSNAQLLDMLVQAARDPDMAMSVFEANLEHFKKFHASLKDMHHVATQAVFTFIVHIHHWGPAMAPDAIAYAAKHEPKVDLTEEPSLERDVRFALWTVRKVYKGFRPAFHQAVQYWQHMILDANTDGSPLPFEVLEGKDSIMYQRGFLLDSAEAKAIPDDHRKVTDLHILKEDGTPGSSKAVFDLGPKTDFPD